MQWTDRIRQVKIILVVVAIVIAITSLLVSHFLVTDLSNDDRNKMEVWAQDKKTLQEDDEKTVFATNVLFSVQSLKMKKPGLSGMYYDYAALGPVLSGLKEDSSGDILVLGNGTGTFQANCMKYFPNSKTVGVEIDKGIIDLSYEFFDLPTDSDISEMD